MREDREETEYVRYRRKKSGIGIGTIVFLLIAVAVIICIGIFGYRLLNKPSPVEAQKELDELWASYPFVRTDARISDELQFRRAKIRKRIRTILSYYPTWGPRGPNPTPTPDEWSATNAKLIEILRENEEYDNSR
jgi:hypothetical protein